MRGGLGSGSRAEPPPDTRSTRRSPAPRSATRSTSLRAASSLPASGRLFAAPSSTYTLNGCACFVHVPAPPRPHKLPPPSSLWLRKHPGPRVYSAAHIVPGQQLCCGFVMQTSWLTWSPILVARWAARPKTALPNPARTSPLDGMEKCCSFPSVTRLSLPLSTQSLGSRREVGWRDEREERKSCSDRQPVSAILGPPLKCLKNINTSESADPKDPLPTHMD